MKNKKEKQMQDFLFSEIEVSDHVLDAARAEMQTKNNAKKAHRFNLRIWIPTLTCIALCCIILPVLLIFLPTLNTNKPDSYIFSDLTKTEIASVQEYNQTNETEILYPKIESTDYLYSDKDTDVLMQSAFTYESVECNLYALIDSRLKVDLLQQFESLLHETTVNEIQVFYQLDDSQFMANFFVGEHRYCLTVASNDADLFWEVVQLIL